MTAAMPVYDAAVAGLINHIKTETLKFDTVEGARQMTARIIDLTSNYIVMLGDDKEVVQATSTIIDSAWGSDKFKNQRAIDYLNKSGKHYYGKFITEEPVKQSLTNILRDKVFGEGVHITQVPDLLEKEFGGALKHIGRGRIEQVARTTAVRARTWGRVTEYYETGVTEMRIKAAMDGKTCAFCVSMNGRVVSVKKVKQFIDRVIDASVEELTPFLTTVNINDLRNMTTEEIVAKYGGTAPFHPRCRCTETAVVDSRNYNEIIDKGQELVLQSNVKSNSALRNRLSAYSEQELINKVNSAGKALWSEKGLENHWDKRQREQKKEGITWWNSQEEYKRAFYKAIKQPDNILFELNDTGLIVKFIKGGNKPWQYIVAMVNMDKNTVMTYYYGDKNKGQKIKSFLKAGDMEARIKEYGQR